MSRGDLVTVAGAGDYGKSPQRRRPVAGDPVKPRPALVLQDDAFDLHPSVVVLPLTSELHDAPLFRVSVPAGGQTGLRVASQIMVDKPTTVPRAKIGPRMGRVSAQIMRAVDAALRGFLGL